MLYVLPPRRPVGLAAVRRTARLCEPRLNTLPDGKESETMALGLWLVRSISMEPWLIAKKLGEALSRREFLRNSALGLGGLTVGWPASVTAQDGNQKLLVDRVRRAIDRGVQFLRDQEEHNGNWEVDGGLAAAYRGGETSLVMLALLNAGVKPDEPIIERNVQWLTDAMKMDGNQLRGWSYGQERVAPIPVNTTDNSNSQYALLGLQ